MPKNPDVVQSEVSASKEEQAQVKEATKQPLSATKIWIINRITEPIKHRMKK